MAKRVQVLLIDDIDGSPADEAVSFALDGVEYTIDLSSANAARLRNDFAAWVDGAQRTGGRRRTAQVNPATRRDDLNQIRQWGRDNGFQVSDRGRVSRELQAAFDKANP